MKHRVFPVRAMILLLSVLMLQGLSTAVWAASKENSGNKAAKIRAVFSQDKERGYPLYALSVDLKKMGKLGKKNTFSGSFLIEKKLLPKNKDAFIIFPEVECFHKNGKLAGKMSARYFIAVIKEKKGYSAYAATESTFKKAGKMAQVKKSAKGLVIEIQNLPLVMDSSALGRNKSYILSPTLWFLADGAGTVSGAIWTDRIRIKGAKEQTITFDRKDYRYLHALTEEGVPVEVQLKATGS